MVSQLTTFASSFVSSNMTSNNSFLDSNNNNSNNSPGFSPAAACWLWWLQQKQVHVTRIPTATHLAQRNTISLKSWHNISATMAESSSSFPHSYSVPKGHGGRVVMEWVDKIYEKTPGFQDVFDEDSFYAFAAAFTILTCVAAFVASRYITIKAKE